MNAIRNILSVVLQLFKMEFNVLGYNLSFWGIFCFSILVSIACYIFKIMMGE